MLALMCAPATLWTCSSARLRMGAGNRPILAMRRHLSVFVEHGDGFTAQIAKDQLVVAQPVPDVVPARHQPVRSLGDLSSVLQVGQPPVDVTLLTMEVSDLLFRGWRCPATTTRTWC